MTAQTDRIKADLAARTTYDASARVLVQSLISAYKDIAAKLSDLEAKASTEEGVSEADLSAMSDQVEAEAKGFESDMDSMMAAFKAGVPASVPVVPGAAPGPVTTAGDASTTPLSVAAGNTGEMGPAIPATPLSPVVVNPNITAVEPNPAPEQPATAAPAVQPTAIPDTTSATPVPSATTATAGLGVSQAPGSDNKTFADPAAAAAAKETPVLPIVDGTAPPAGTTATPVAKPE